MKFEYLLAILLLAITSCKKDNDSDDDNTLPPSSTQTQTVNLKNDNYSDGNSINFQTGFTAGEEAAATLGPISNTFKITYIKFFLGGTGIAETKDITLRIYNDDGNTNPGSLIFDSTLTLTSSEDTFQEVDLRSSNVIISGGGSLRVSLEPGLGLPSVGTDTDGTIDNTRNWIYSLGTWTDATHFLLTGDFIIRAVVEENI